jgi:hypothetical protein
MEALLFIPPSYFGFQISTAVVVHIMVVFGGFCTVKYTFILVFQRNVLPPASRWILK